MNDSRSYITLDFRNTHMPVVVKAKRGDTARTLYISLADGGVPYRIADGCFATFTAKKPDRTVINNSCTIEGNRIVYRFTDQTCSAAGRMSAEIRLYGSNGRMLTSASFILEVHRTVFNPGDIPASEDDMNALDALILETTALKEEVETKLENGEFIGEAGPPGKSAYEFALDGGYQGSPEEFAEKMAGRDKDNAPAFRLLISILRAALYGSNQADNINLLAQMLGIEISTKLKAPIICLETITDPEETTPAILGKALLGRTILGVYRGFLPKLGTPAINLEVIPKLDTPEINLEFRVTTDTGGDTPGMGQTPSKTKLATPEIQLHKLLDTPQIYMEQHPGPLPTPSIYLDSYLEYTPSALLGTGVVGYAVLRGCLDAPEIELEAWKLAAPTIELDIRKLNTPSITMQDVYHYEIGETIWLTNSYVDMDSVYPTVENGKWVEVLDSEGNQVSKSPCTLEIHEEHGPECYDSVYGLICEKPIHTAKRHNSYCLKLGLQYQWIVVEKETIT